MASIKDVPVAVKSMGVVGFLKKVFAEVSADGVFTWASALAYSWVFALFPLVLVIVTLAPYLPGQKKAEVIDNVTQSLQRAGVGGDAGVTITNSIKEVMDKSQGGLLSVGLLLAIWGASGGMAMTMTALDKAYGVKTERSFIKQRGIAVALTLASVLLVLVVLVLLPIGGAITAYFADKGAIGKPVEILIDVLRYVIAAGLLIAVVSMVYYFGPNIKQKFQAVSPGAITAVVVWVLLGIGFGIYVKSFGKFNETYGALGAGIVLLLFFYLSATILLIGAEINSTIDFAVLGVEPGTRDFTQRVQKGELKPTDASTASADAMSPQSGEEGIKPPTGAEPARPAKAYAPAAPIVHAPAGWWKWAAAAVIGGWAYKKAEQQVTGRYKRAIGG